MRLIVFDLDGTLSDSRAAILATFADACRAHGEHVPTEDAISARIGLPLEEMFSQVVPRGDAAALSATYRSTYIPHDAVHTRLFPGAIDLLVALADRRLAIATSKSQKGAENSVTRAGIRPHFDVVLGQDSVARPKPHADMLVEVMRRAGVAPDRTVMVGDTTFDLEMADAAGVRGIGVAWGHHGAERLGRWEVAGSMRELGGLLG
ncbi:MAG: HAD family hydrolase [Proteobacteria bacterium]|nr:HAD family hydrolase [Pseudomonadota bacterium]MCP4921082.1 HAD family hydrolase [Pseudomonadota bacterium]